MKKTPNDSELMMQALDIQEELDERNQALMKINDIIDKMDIVLENIVIDDWWEYNIDINYITTVNKKILISYELELMDFYQKDYFNKEEKQMLLKNINTLKKFNLQIKEQSK